MVPVFAQISSAVTLLLPHTVYSLQVLQAFFSTMFGHLCSSFQLVAYCLLVLPSLVSSHPYISTNTVSRGVVLVHQTKDHFHAALHRSVHDIRRRSQEGQRMEGLSSGQHGPPSSPRPGTVSRIDDSPPQRGAGRVSPAHIPPIPPRPGRVNRVEASPSQMEAGRLSPLNSPPGSPRAGTVAHSEITPAQEEAGRLLASSHGSSSSLVSSSSHASTGSHASSGSHASASSSDSPPPGIINRLGTQRAAQIRRMCAPVAQLWNPPGMSEDDKTLRKMCCKFFTGFYIITAAGPVFTEISPKLGAGMYMTGGVLGIHGMQDLFKLMATRPSEPTPSPPPSRVKRRRSINGWRMKELSELSFVSPYEH